MSLTQELLLLQLKHLYSNVKFNELISLNYKRLELKENVNVTHTS